MNCGKIPCGLRSTINYQLPQWDANSITSWMTQLNYAMKRIDEVMHGLALRSSIDGIANEVILDVEKLNREYEQLVNNVCSLQTEVTNNTVSNTSLQTQVTTLTTQVQTLTTNLVNVDTRLSTAESTMLNIQATLAKLSENLNTATSSIAELEARVTALEGGD